MATISAPAASVSAAASREWCRSRGGDPHDRQVAVAVGGVDGGDLVQRPVGELDADRPGLADDVEVRGHEPCTDEEPGAEPLIAAAPAAEADRDDRRFHPAGELLDGLVRLLFDRLVGRTSGRCLGRGLCETVGPAIAAAAQHGTSSRTSLVEPHRET